jgi:hypothetical protein
MTLANDETNLAVLDTLNFVALNSLQNNKPIALGRRKLIIKIDKFNPTCIK